MLLTRLVVLSADLYCSLYSLLETIKALHNTLAYRLLTDSTQFARSCYSFAQSLGQRTQLQIRSLCSLIDAIKAPNNPRVASLLTHYAAYLSNSLSNSVSSPMLHALSLCSLPDATRYSITHSHATKLHHNSHAASCRRMS